jgi:hypothetical protein
MALFVLPCGLSVFDNLRKGPGSSGATGVQPAATKVKSLLHWANQPGLLEHEDLLDGWLQDGPTRLVTQEGPAGLALCRWPRELLSAELASLAAHNVPPPFGDRDRVVLLASDTNEGVLAALLNATRLGRRTRYRSTPPTVRDPGRARVVQRIEHRDGAPVEVIRIPRLLPDTNADFPQATGHIAHTLLWAVEQPEARDGGVVLHLAGGYKATLPFLLVLAEYVRERARSLPGGVRAVSVWCKHEHGTEAIRIPLRRVDLRDLDILPRIPHGAAIGTDSPLDGLAFEGRTLTEVGQALDILRDALALGDRPVP